MATSISDEAMSSFQNIFNLIVFLFRVNFTKIGKKLNPEYILSKVKFPRNFFLYDLRSLDLFTKCQQINTVILRN